MSPDSLCKLRKFETTFFRSSANDNSCKFRKEDRNLERTFQTGFIPNLFADKNKHVYFFSYKNDIKNHFSRFFYFELSIVVISQYFIFFHHFNFYNLLYIWLQVIYVCNIKFQSLKHVVVWITEAIVYHRFPFYRPHFFNLWYLLYDFIF